MSSAPHTPLKEVRATMVLAGPVVAAQLGHMSMGFVDTVMVGRLGSEELAGVALGNNVLFFLMLVCTGIVIAVGPMVSQAYGAGRAEPIGRSARQGLWLGVALAVPSTLLIWNASPILLSLGQHPETVARAVSYLHAIVWGVLPFLWFAALRSFVEGLSRPLPVTFITFIAALLNVGANYVLMYGKLGFPAMGIAGTGLASTFVYWFQFAALTAYVLWEPGLRRYGVFERLGKPDGQYFRELVRIGWPIGVSYGIESGLFMMTALMMGVLGTTALAAHQVALQCAAFTFMVPLGIGIAGSVRVGQAVGRGDAAGVRWAGYAAIGLAAAFMLLAAIGFWAFPEAIISLYLDRADVDNAEVIRLAVRLLGIAAVFQLFDGVQVAAAGALRGLKDTRVPMIIGFLTYWAIGLTAGYGLGFLRGDGPEGLWWGLVLGLASAAVVLAARFGRLARRTEHRMEDRAREPAEEREML